MRILFISIAIPSKSGSGVGARMHLNTLKRIVGEDNVFVIDLSTASSPDRKNNYIAYGKYKGKIERIRRTLQGHSYYMSNAIANDICNVIHSERIDFVFLDDSTFGKLVARIHKKCKGIPVVSFFHDVKAELFPIWIKRSRWVDRINYKVGIKNEKISVNEADKNIVLNRAEDELLQRHYGIIADYYLPVCVEEPNFGNNNPFDNTGKKHIIFVGTSYKPNIIGIKWFVTNVFPFISTTFDLWILGKGLECLQLDFSDEPDIHVIGYVDTLHPYYEFADVVIAPLTDGGGMKIKTAEAFSFGKVFLGSSESLHGYYEELPNSLKNKIVFSCDSAQEYITVFHSLSVINQRNEDLINLYKAKYSPEAAYMQIKHIVEETLGRQV